MPGHYGQPAHNIITVSSPVGTQLLHAVGIALAARIRRDRPGRDDVDRRGQRQPGRLPRGRSTSRPSTSPPFIFVVENNGYAISVPGEAVAMPDVADRRRVRHPGGRRRRGGRARLLRGRTRGGERARRGDGPTLIEAKVLRLTAHSSDDQQTSTGRPRSSRPRRSATRCRASRRSSGAGVLDDETRRRCAPSSSSWSTTRPRRRGAGPDPAIRTTAMRHVYAEGVEGDC